jgi:hypothetical protein
MPLFDHFVVLMHFIPGIAGHAHLLPVIEKI